MASPVSTPELSRLSSTSVSPLEYFTDSSDTINIKSDVVLVVGKDKFFCHRLLLSLVSPVFTRMFDGEFREHHDREIKLEGKTSASILDLLAYIYPQFNGRVTNDNIEDFLLLADEYMIEHLKQPCKDILIQQLQSFKFVSLPSEQKLKQPSIKSKHFHASDSALNSSQHHDDESSLHQNSNRAHQSRRPASSFRHHSAKPTPAYLKICDKTGASSQTSSRYVLFLDQTRMPEFYDIHNASVSFTTVDVELWLRRLRVLYQIDRSRYYGEIIDQILAILQFIPTSQLCSLAHVTMDTCSIDEIMLNDIARARVYMLEEWATDGDSYRLVHLTESYRTMSPSVLAAAARQSQNTKIPVVNPELMSYQETILTPDDFEASAAASDSDVE